MALDGLFRDITSEPASAFPFSLYFILHEGTKGNYDCGLKQGSSSGGRTGWLVTARLLGQSSVEVSLRRRLTLTAPDTAGCRLAWLTAASVCVRQYCE